MKLAAVETTATSCGKGVIGIKACSNDGKKKSELEVARRSARGGAAMTSVVQEPVTATIDEAVASIDADLLPSSGRRSCAVGVVDERRGGGGSAIYRRAAEEMDQRTCSDTMIN